MLDFFAFPLSLNNTSLRLRSRVGGAVPQLVVLCDARYPKAELTGRRALFANCFWGEVVDALEDTLVVGLRE